MSRTARPCLLFDRRASPGYRATPCRSSANAPPPPPPPVSSPSPNQQVATTQVGAAALEQAELEAASGEEEDTTGVRQATDGPQPEGGRVQLARGACSVPAVVWELEQKCHHSSL